MLASKTENADKAWLNVALELGRTFAVQVPRWSFPILRLLFSRLDLVSELWIGKHGLISKREGDFLYDTRILMLHRIHEDSECHLIHDNRREKEDLEMLSFWPAPAKLINLAYKSGQRSNA